MPTFGEFVSDQRKTLPIAATTEKCSGATYIVVGANAGLGFEASKHLVRLGSARVVMACRNLGAGDQAKAEIEQETGVRGVAEVWQLDLANWESVRTFAKKATAELDRVDALIMNAGVALAKWTEVEGYETSIKINVLGTFLLSVLMMPKLQESAKQFKNLPQITIVASRVGFDAKKELDKIRDDPVVKLNDPKATSMFQRYPLSKLIQILAVRHFATLFPPSRTGVVVNVLSPGLCHTKLSKNGIFLMRMVVLMMNLLFGRTPEMGSRTLLHGAVAGKESHGCYLAACEIRENEVPSWVDDDEGKQAQKRVWDGIAKILETVEPGCVEKIL